MEAFGKEYQDSVVTYLLKNANRGIERDIDST